MMVAIAQHFTTILSLAFALVHILGLVSAIDALYWVRSSQSAIAWCLSLLVFPYGAVPLYWIFGRSHFKGYRELIRRFSEINRKDLELQQQRFHSYIANEVSLDKGVEKSIEAIAQSEFSSGNEIELLIDGPEIFQTIKTALLKAQKYILIQFYIVKNDSIGEEIKNILIQRAAAGVAVFFLYDEIGSASLEGSFVSDLTAAGVKIVPFATRQGIGNFLQFNFRNHRKIVVIDGLTGFVGGVNIGDEYLGLDQNIGYWRDTNISIEGPAVIQLQKTFLADWTWATQTAPRIEWQTPDARGTLCVLPVATGPVEEDSRCAMLFQEVIRSVKERLWIASPYFVPDEATLAALKLAVLRGVDVRILLPEKPDHFFVWLASFSYINEVVAAGVKVFRYTKGFMHQKVVLADSNLAVVGTANFDNRSFHLNFEISVFVADTDFALQVSKMLENDFESSSVVTDGSHDLMPLYVKLGSKFARLFAPIL